MYIVIFQKPKCSLFLKVTASSRITVPALTTLLPPPETTHTFYWFDLS